MLQIVRSRAVMLSTLVAIALMGCSSNETKKEDDAAKPQAVAAKPTYTEADFLWDDGVPEGKPYKTQIVASVNRLVRENARCASVVTDSLAPMEGQFSKKHPIFWVPCKTADGDTFGTTFNAKEAAIGHESLAAAKIIDAGVAMRLCKEAAKQDAAHPDTVDFSIIMDAGFQSAPSGKARLTSSFKAKNSFGVEDKYRIYCFYNGEAMVEHNIKPWVD